MALANGRCRLHGGLSTGPKTQQGRLRALANLRQFPEQLADDPADSLADRVELVGGPADLDGNIARLNTNHENNEPPEAA